MTIHLILLIFICILGYFLFEKKISKTRNRYFVILSFLLIFIVQAIRGSEVGADTLVYVNSYLKINLTKSSWEVHNWEPGYVLLNKVVGSVK